MFKCVKLTGIILAAVVLQATAEVSVLTNLKKNHPRIFLSNNKLALLKKQHVSDKTLQRYLKDVLKQADEFVGLEPLVYEIPDGLRLLGVSRKAINRIHTLGFAYRWTGDRKYADQAVKEMMAVCAFKDWNPRHFLDTAEMCNAVGVGYDWLFDYMDENTREQIKSGLIKNGLAPNPGGQVKRINNWNMVCNSGLIVGALAIAETDPQYAEKIIPRAVKYMPNALENYTPNGAWMEGPGYWHYATRYVAYGLDAMDTALGTNFDLDKTIGLDQSGLFPIYSTGPSGEFLCFADAHFQDLNNPKKRKVRGGMPCMFWLADKYDNSFISNAEHKILENRKAEVHHLIWYVAPEKSGEKAQLDYKFDGPVPVAFMRGGWRSKGDSWVGVKAGYNRVPHGHLDLGNFEFENDGIRWALDIGSDEYNLPGYWSGRENGKRWSYWRLNSFSHNVPLIAGKGQLVEAAAEISGFKSAKEQAQAVIDLTEAYSDRADKVLRKVSLINNRTEMVVEDEFVLKQLSEVVWGMTTDADIEIVSDCEVVLSRNGKKLRLLAECNTEASFKESQVEQKEKPYRSRKGFRRLHLVVPAKLNKVNVKVLFSKEK